jgi:hypothetical protein
MIQVDVRHSSSSTSPVFASGNLRLVVPHPSLPVLSHPALVVLIAIQHPALLQMAPVLEVSPQTPASTAEGVLGLAH